MDDPIVRFCKKIHIENEDGCWIWFGAITPRGYGSMKLTGKKNVSAHRFSYESLVGKIPKGLTIDHTCRVRNCVNPKHLEPVTMYENMKRGFNPAAINLRKTRCKNGHKFDRVKSSGHRWCLRCNNAQAKAWTQKYGRKKTA